MKASRTWRLTLARQQIVVGNLTSGFTSALRDRESRDGTHAISRLAQRIECFGQPKSQRADHACSHHCDTGIRLFLVYAAWLSHLKKKELPRNFYCIPIRSILQMTQAETEARKLVDCQLSLFSDDLKSDRREQ